MVFSIPIVFLVRWVLIIWQKIIMAFLLAIARLLSKLGQSSFPKIILQYNSTQL